MGGYKMKICFCRKAVLAFSWERNMNYHKIILGIFFFITLSSCSHGADGSIIIRDYIVGLPYEIIAVDGNPPKRQEHGLIVTYVPFVLVAEGDHVLTVKPISEHKMNKYDKRDEIIKISITVKNNEEYSLEKINGLPELVVCRKK